MLKHEKRRNDICAYNVLGLVDSTGEEVVRFVYDAWGEVLNVTGSMASTLGVLNPFRYRGYIYDTETKWYYLRSRYYSPVWKRFVNADILYNENVYTYCNNQSVMRVDENGTEGEKYQIKSINNGIIVDQNSMRLINTFKGKYYDAFGNTIDITVTLPPMYKLNDVNLHISDEYVPSTSENIHSIVNFISDASFALGPGLAYTVNSVAYLFGGYIDVANVGSNADSILADLAFIAGQAITTKKGHYHTQYSLEFNSSWIFTQTERYMLTICETGEHQAVYYHVFLSGIFAH